MTLVLSLASIWRRAAVALALAATGAAAAAPAVARGPEIDPDFAEMSNTVRVTVGASSIVRASTPFAQVVVGDPDVVELAPTTDRSFYLIGKDVGRTNVVLYSTSRQVVEIFDILVEHDLRSLEADLAALLPGEPIEVRAVADGVVLSGTVSSAPTVMRAMQVAERHAPGAVTNALGVRGRQQVLLEVRFVEASRETLREIGLGGQAFNAGDFSVFLDPSLIGGFPGRFAGALSTSIGQTSIDLLIEALEEKGQVRSLAQPNLVALSGDTASFLAGGEFPFPVQADEDRVAIEFRPFGVGLAFTPTVLDGEMINLRVAPEVSQLDVRNTVRLAGVEVPALSVRRAETTIEMKSGQSFAIAGLFQSNLDTTVAQTPGLANLPILGPLFRSTRYRNNETELVIIVTPHLAAPSAPAALTDPFAELFNPDAPTSAAAAGSF